MQHRGVITWLLAGCLLICTMVIIGGITRLTRSGLSIVEWKPTGSLPPMSEAEWNVQFEKYRQTPEFRLINSSFTLSDYKKIFWWEYIHRLIGRTIGFVFIIPFLFFIWKKKFPPGYLKRACILLSLGAMQGIIGWIMVKSGLNKEPHVSHYLLATHLSAALLTYSLTFWYALDLMQDRNVTVKGISLRRPVIFLFVLVSLQIIYGAFVAGLKAGLVYNTFPKMGETWIAPGCFALQPGLINLIANGTCVQFIHRVLAAGIVIFSIYLFFRSRGEVTAKQKKGIVLLLITIGIQFLLGVFTLLYAVPVSLGSLHQLGAFFVLTVLLYNLHLHSVRSSQ